MGAEHLVSDTASAREYLNQELARITLDELLPWYSEPCGIEGNYTRVSLRTVKEGLISAEDLLSAFIASANSEERPSVYSWAKVWHEMIAAIDRMEPELPMYEQDKLFIEQVLAQGQYAISHSPDYATPIHLITASSGATSSSVILSRYCPTLAIVPHYSLNI